MPLFALLGQANGPPRLPIIPRLTTIARVEEIVDKYNE
jgi:hypothetical protein